MSKSAGQKHHAHTRGQTIREWANEKFDRNYVTRRELKQFLTIYDKAAARIRGEESDRIEGVLLMTLQRLNEWNALPWWRRLFASLNVPVIAKAAPPEGIQPEQAEETLDEAAGEQDVGAEEGGLATHADLPVVEQPAAMSRELAWACGTCGNTGMHLVAQSDLNPLPPTCWNCGGSQTKFVHRFEEGGA